MNKFREFLATPFVVISIILAYIAKRIYGSKGYYEWAVKMSEEFLSLIGK